MVFSNRYLSAPNQVCFAITNRCNLSCKHCCTEVGGYGEELTYKEILGIIDQLEAAKVFQIQVFGGEPLLRKEIWHILHVLKKKPFSVSMNTNCTLITDDVVKELKKVYPIGLCTSIDGSCPEVHDKLRGAGSFEKTLKGVQKLISEGMHVLAEAVVNRYNLRDLTNIASLAKEIGISNIVFVPVFYGGQARCFQEDIGPSEEDYLMGNEIAKELIDKFPGYAGGALIDGYFKNENFKKMKNKKGQRAAKIGLCGAARTTMGIRADGQVIPCSALWEMPAGSLKEKTLIDIWQNSPVMKQFREVDNKSLDSIEECSKCNYKYFCNANCRASAFYHSGSIHGFTPDCNYFREQHHEKIKAKYGKHASAVKF